MKDQGLYIEAIEIEKFKKIRSLVIQPEKRANLFFGSSRSGKTSLCEFIQFALYGADSVALPRGNAEDALGKLVLRQGKQQFLILRSVISGKEELQFLDGKTGNKIATDLTPGEYLTGLDQDAFDLIAYFKQARYETPVFKPKFSFLHQISASKKETENIYPNALLAQKEMEKFHNDQKNGSLDLLLAEKSRIQSELEEFPQLEKKAEEIGNSLREIAEKLDGNDRRCVLLKADMASFTDDLKLSRNKENAEDLHRRIQAKEKKLRLVSFDVTNKVGKLSKEELEDLKNDYNRLSLAVTSLTEARVALSSAEDNLAFHEKLFTGNDNEEHYGREKRKIQVKRRWRTVFLIFGVLLVICGTGLCPLLYFPLSFDLTTSLAAGGSLALCGIALSSVSTVFSGAIGKILAENQKNSVEELEEFYDRLRAHAKTTHVYRDQLEADREICKKRSDEKDAAQAVISQKLQNLGYSEDQGELLAICDEIIEANDALIDLEQEIEEDRAEYKRLLSVDVESDSLTVSSEFLALQKELSFLSVQNDALYKKKAMLSAQLQETRQKLERSPDQIHKDLEEVDKRITELSAEFESVELNFTLAKSRKDKFEEELKGILTKQINEKLSFLLGEGERFLFDEEFELCFCDQKSVLPLITAGGGVITEMGLLAFRLCLCRLLKKNFVPMIFDDSFAMLSRDATNEMYQVLKESCSQFFIASSSEELYKLCQDTAKILPL